MLPAALKALQRCRLPDGAYTYSVAAIPRAVPGRPDIDNIKGSLSRIQICNLALYTERAGVTQEDLEKGLDLFFRHHRFLEVACYRPIPHEAYYANAGYFFLYGHAYAGQVIGRLPRDKRGPYRERLERALLPFQSPDGSWWDFPWQGYDKTYGTAFALIALAPTP